MARRTTRVGPSSGKDISNLVAFSNLSADFNLSDPLTNFTPSSFEPCPNSNISSALAEPGTIRGSFTVREPRPRFRHIMTTWPCRSCRQRQAVHVNCLLILVLLFVQLAKVVANDGVLQQVPSRTQILLHLIQCPHSKINPA